MTQLGILRAIQSLHTPLLDRFFIGVTMLGSEEFFLLVIPILYWCVDRELGRRLARLFLFSSFLNLWWKHAFRHLRPPADQVRVLFAQSGGGYSFPSGHAQGSATFWGYLAIRGKRRWFALLAGALALLVAFSRLYLGVHWPADVVAGLALGTLLAWIWARLERWWDAELSVVARPIRATAAFILPLLLLFLDRSPDAVKVAGTLVGFSGGAALVGESPRTVRAERLGRQVSKVLLGITGLLLIRAGLKGVFPAGLVFDGLRYGLIGLWAGFVVPWLFDFVWPARPELR